MSLPCERLIGWRYLRAKPFQTVISVLGVFLGMVALIVAYSIWSGLEAILYDRLISSEPHLTAQKIGKPFNDYEEFIANMETKEKVVAAAPSVKQVALIQNLMNGRRSGVEIRGIDSERGGYVTRIHSELQSYQTNPLAEDMEDMYAEGGPLNFDRPDIISFGRSKLPEGDTIAGGIIVGEAVAATLGIDIGDPALLYTDVERIAGRIIASIRTFIVIDIYRSGVYALDSRVAYVELSAAQRAFNMGDAVTRVDIRTAEPDDADAVKKEIQAEYGMTYHPRTWKERWGEMFALLELEKVGAAIIFALIVVVASFSIAVMILMLVKEKTREIGILKAMGMSDGAVLRIFALYSAAIGGMGAVAGTLGSLGLCWLITQLEIPLPKQFYYISTVPVEISWPFIGLVNALTMAVCLGVSFLPSRRASLMDPVEALRYE